MTIPENCILVIFGASGDLTKKKLVPALFSLFKQNLLPKCFAVLGIGRSSLSDESFREKMELALKDGIKFIANLANDVRRFAEDILKDLNLSSEEGKLLRDDIVADFYNLDAFERQSNEEITLFKNGGGAHLDLMTSRYILDVWKNR